MDLENYVNVHTTAHLVSSENGEMISESKKVENFLMEIAMSSPEMSAGKEMVLSTSNFRNNFSEPANFLGNFIELMPRIQNRNIRNVYRGGHGRVHDRGHGRGGSSSGRR